MGATASLSTQGMDTKKQAIQPVASRSLKLAEAKSSRRGRPSTLTQLASPGQGTTAPNIPIAMGAYQDFEYIEGSGDLDQCNGK